MEEYRRTVSKPVKKEFLKVNKKNSQGPNGNVAYFLFFTIHVFGIFLPMTKK